MSPLGFKFDADHVSHGTALDQFVAPSDPGERVEACPFWIAQFDNLVEDGIGELGGVSYRLVRPCHAFTPVFRMETG